MAGLSIITGDATSPTAGVIVHVCNDLGRWGRGFVLAISGRWPQPEAVYKSAFRKRPHPSLGTTQFVRVREGPDPLWVVNMIAQHKIGRGARRIQYDHLTTCLVAVRKWMQTQSPPLTEVHMPRIGCGLGGGEWSVIEAIVRATLVNHSINVIVYDMN